MPTEEVPQGFPSMETSEQARIRELLTSHIVSLCNTSMEYGEEVTIEGLLGITVDKKDIILVNIKEVILGPPEKVEAVQESPASLLPSESIMPKLRAALQGSSPAAACSRKGKRKARPFKIPYSERLESKKALLDSDPRDSDGECGDVDLSNVKTEALASMEAESPDVSQDSVDSQAQPPELTPEESVVNPGIYAESPSLEPADESDLALQWMAQHPELDSCDSGSNEPSLLASQNGENSSINLPNSAKDDTASSNSLEYAQYTQELDSDSLEGLDPMSIVGYQPEQGQSRRRVGKSSLAKTASQTLDYALPQVRA